MQSSAASIQAFVSVLRDWELYTALCFSPNNSSHPCFHPFCFLCQQLCYCKSARSAWCEVSRKCQSSLVEDTRLYVYWSQLCWSVLDTIFRTVSARYETNPICCPGAGDSGLFRLIAGAVARRADSATPVQYGNCKCLCTSRFLWLPWLVRVVVACCCCHHCCWCVLAGKSTDDH